MLVTEKKDPFVRACAAQSVVFSLVWIVSSLFFRGIPLVGKLLRFFVHMAGAALWLAQILKAAGHRVYVLPGITDLSHSLEKRLHMWQEIRK